MPISLVRLEVTFSASRFAEILRGAPGACSRNVTWSFVSWDLLFPLAYGPLLCALFLWVERWRRFDTEDVPLPESPSRRDVIVLAPLVAAALDMMLENLPLWYAASRLGQAGSEPSPLVTAAVLIGSGAALLKWLLLVLSVAGILIELLSGPRGAVLWRARFSVLALVLGGVPLLAVAQGQDILQRLFEGDHPAWRLTTAVPPAVLVATAIWYCSRKLGELELDDSRAIGDHGWYRFFAEHIPRILGIGLLVLVGLAFARAGLVGDSYVIVGALGFFAALWLRRFLPRPLAAVGRLFMLPAWRTVPDLDVRLGGAVLASFIGLVVLWADKFPVGSKAVALPAGFDPQNAWTVLYLRLAAYFCLVAAWVFELFVRFRRTARNARLAAAGRPGA